MRFGFTCPPSPVPPARGVPNIEDPPEVTPNFFGANALLQKSSRITFAVSCPFIERISRSVLLGSGFGSVVIQIKIFHCKLESFIKEALRAD
ncbi:MAG: hypothetical protein JRF57_05645 [Deltaproteobacteria bacterium]|nr:hypothetical protein [Deltaproteobacteria bacterium]